MARTKDRKAYYQAKRANELATVATCMDGWLRRSNASLEKKIEELQSEVCGLISEKDEEERKFERMRLELYRRCTAMLQNRDRQIEEMQSNWEDLSNTLHRALTDLETYRMINRRLTEQLLDCTCRESETECEDLTSQ
jgi:predicted nuclease with TOPRIM domain